MGKVTLKSGTRGHGLTSTPQIAPRNAHAQYAPKGGTLIAAGQKALAMRAKQVLKGVASSTEPLT